MPSRPPAQCSQPNAAGQSREQLLADFPDLDAKDLNAALAYPAREIDHPVGGHEALAG
ncbi:MAG: DUF433 domain-containing protein [Synechococcaceae cyanobacterium]